MSLPSCPKTALLFGFYCEEIKGTPVMYRKEMETGISAKTRLNGAVYEGWSPFALFQVGPQ